MLEDTHKSAVRCIEEGKTEEEALTQGKEEIQPSELFSIMAAQHHIVLIL